MPDPAPHGVVAGSGRLRLGRRGLRRVRSQAGLISALLAVFALCSVAAGTGALLLTTGNDRALSVAVSQADGNERNGGADIASMMVTAATPEDDVPQTRAASFVPLVRTALLDAAAPYRAQVSTWSRTPMLFLGGRDVRAGYLMDADNLTANATLTVGSWPTASGGGAKLPVAIPASTAAALGIGVGAELRLSRDLPGSASALASYDLVVTGIFTPSRTPAWARDPMRGRGYEPSYLRLPTYGPFVVAPGTLERLDAPLERVAAVLDPDLAGDAVGVPGLVQRVNGVADGLKDTLGTAISPTLVVSALGSEFNRMQAELAVTNALVLAVFVLVLALGVATAALVARVLVGRRATELTLLRDRGAGTGQLVRSAVAEASLIGLAAAALAAPITLAGYGLIAPAAVAGSSWLAGVPVGWFALALLGGAALPAVVMVIIAIPERPRRGRQVIAGPLARSGIDLMLAVVAVLAYLQLRAHVVTPGVVDPLLVVAPALAVLALAALVTRLLPLIARLAEASAGRSRGLVLPMAGWHLARGGATQGTFLLVLAAAVGTLGVTFVGTWSQSQVDQAAAQVGAQMVVTGPDSPEAVAELATLAGGSLAPVGDHPVVLGSRPSGVKMLALEAQVADQMITSRPPPGQTWSQAMAPLVPASAGKPLTVSGGPLRISLTGSLRGVDDPGRPVPVLTATPTLILLDQFGFTTTMDGTELALDGRPHSVEVPLTGRPGLPAGHWQIVAIDLLLTDHTRGDLISWGNDSAVVNASIGVEGAAADADGAWDGVGGAGFSAIQVDKVSVHGSTVDASFTFSVLGVSWQPAHITLLSFPASNQVPVAITDALAGELGLKVGDRIAMAWETTQLEAVIARTVAYVPAHPGEAALMTDLTSLRRAMLSAGQLDPVLDRWWVSSPRPGAAAAIRDAGAGTVVDRAETVATLRDGPLRAPLSFAWLLAVVVAVGLAITGSAAHAAAQAQRRGITIARLRAIGASRAEMLAGQLAQHATVTGFGVVLGAGCGAVLAVLLVPLLVVAPSGERAAPDPILIWSAAPLAVSLGAILLGGLLAGLPAALSVVRRSTVAALRAGEAG